MFNQDLETFMLENVNFEVDKANQDIYYNMNDKRFWIHKYMVNESLSPESDKENVLIYKIRNNLDWETWNGCESCESRGTNTCRFEECQAKALYDTINESDYIFDNIRGQILSKINPDVIPFVNISIELSEHYDKRHEYMQKVFNSSLYGDIEEDIIEGILSYGFSESENDNTYLSVWIENLKQQYLPNHPNLKHLFQLLDDYKVKEAAAYLKGIEATL